MKNADILQQLEQMCGNVIILSNGWYQFVYNQICFVNIPDKGDGNLRICIPHVANINDYHKNFINGIINSINRDVQFLKVFVLWNGSISLNYDHKIMRKDNASEIVPHMVNTLYAGYHYLMKIIH